MTALFADIKGSTELKEDLYPEEARAIVDPALKIIVEAVRRSTVASYSRPATASSRCWGRRSHTRTIRSARSMLSLRMQEELPSLFGRRLREAGGTCRSKRASG